MSTTPSFLFPKLSPPLLVSTNCGHLTESRKVQTAWADFHRREREVRFGHFFFLLSIFFCLAKVVLPVVACRPQFNGKWSPIFQLSRTAVDAITELEN